MDLFRTYLSQYDSQKLETVKQTAMKTLAATHSYQRGIQYESGLEFMEYTAQKAAGTLVQTHLRPFSKLFSEKQLDEIPIDTRAMGK